MLRSVFDLPPDTPLKVLCLGAHSDDIEIGCGGTLLKLARQYPGLEVWWVVFSGGGPRRAEATASAEAFLAPVRTKKVLLKEFRDGYFPYQGPEIKDYFEQLKPEFSPDLILTHYREDLHQDHRQISSLAWNTYRNHLIWEFEIPKYDGDLGRPNLYVPLAQAEAAQKVEYILKYFPSQATRQWFSEDTFRALLRLRGVECNAPERYAEAFYARKIIF